MLRRLIPQSLAARACIAISVVLLVGIAGIAAVSLRTFHAQLTSVLSSGQDLLLGRICENIDQRLELLQGILQRSANKITLADLSSHDRAQAVLERNDGLAAAFDRSIFLFSPKGILLGERPDRNDRVGLDASWRPYIKRTIETRQPVISEPFKTNVGDDHIVLVLTMPILAADGRLVGLLTGSLDLTRPDMLGNISRTVIGRSGYLAITTRDGKVIMDRNKSRLSKPLYAPGENATFDRALAGFEGTTEGADESGRPSFISYRMIKRAGWIVSASYPRDEAYRDGGEHVTHFLWVLGGSTLLALLAIWVVTRYFTRPLIALTRHISAYSPTDGRIEPLPGVTRTGSGEVHALTKSFNALTASLNAREQTLRRSNEVLATVLENLPCGLSVYGADLLLLATNAEHHRIFDRPEAPFEHPGTNLANVLRYHAARGDYGSEQGEATVQVLLGAARGCNEGYRAEHTRPDGTTIEMAATPMPEGGLVLIYNDVTARKKAEQALARQTERLRLATESAGIGVWEYDLVEGAVEWDDICYRIYGTSRTGKTGALDLWSKHLHPDDAPWVLAALKAALDGDADYAPEFRICRPDGEIRYVQATAHVARDATGRAVRMMGMNMDVTAQRLAQFSLTEAKRAAESANIAKSQFLANMSHEIRTPMNAILGMLTLLQRTAMTLRQADYVDKTEGAARSLLRLLNEILDYSKVEAGKMTLDPHPFKIDDLLRDVSLLMSASLGAKPVTLRFDVPASLPGPLVGDAMRLQQVLLNLVGNAIKFTAAGEVVLSIRVLQQTDADVTLVFAVIDTGIGISPENHRLVFSGFGQAEASITRRFGGTGLGLAISQQLVALMGGELRLDSALGEGSRFHFELTLPLASTGATEPRDVPRLPDAAQPGPVPPGNHQRLAGLRLLVTEDNPDNRQIARELLEAEGAQVCMADDGQQAVAAVAQARPPFDLVLMDLQMPVMDGYTATRLIRQSCGSQALPIVAMTANVMAADRQACLAAGMNDHVGKPFDLDHLVDVVRRHVGLSQCEPRLAGHATSALAPSVLDAAAQAGVDLRSALDRLGQRVDIYERALRSFLLDLVRLPSRLRDRVDQADFQAVAAALHTLKGLAATLGAGGLSDAAALAERLTKGLVESRAPPDSTDGAIDAICDAIDVAHPTLSTLLHALQAARECESADSGAESPYDPAAYLGNLEALSVLLASRDMAAADCMDALQRRVGGARGQGLRLMADAIEVLDFELALMHCTRLLATAAA